MTSSVPSAPTITAPVPRWLRVLHGLATAALSAALVLWMLLLVAAALLYFWAIPHIDSLRPRLEFFLSEQMHTPVQIERISVQNVQGFPTFDLHHVKVLPAATPGLAAANPSAAALLTLAKVSVSVSPLSLLQLKAERWMLDAPSVHIHRSSAGVWSVAGITADPNAKPGAALDWLLSQKEIIVERAAVTLQDDFLKQPTRSAAEALVVIRRGLRSHSIRVDAKLDKASGESVQFVGQFKQPLLDSRAGHWQAWTGDVYARVVAPQVGSFAPYLSPPLGKPSASEFSLARVIPLLDHTAQLEVWAKVVEGRASAVDVALLGIPDTVKRLKLQAQFDTSQPAQGLPTQIKLQGEQWDLTSSARIAQALGASAQWLAYAEHAKPSGQITQFQLDATPDKLSVRAQLNSVDAAGTLEATASAASSASSASQPFAFQPSTLEFKAKLDRLDVTAISRFLPASLPLAARQYVQASLEKGVARDVHAHVRLKDKTFKVTGAVSNVQFAFAPNPASNAAWPSLIDAKAHITLEAASTGAVSLAIPQIDAVFAGLPVKGSVHIGDLKQPIAQIAVQSKAPLQQLLAMLEATPMKGYTQSVLSKAEGSGLADAKVAISVPVARLAQTTVQGEVLLGGSASLRLNPLTPTVSNLKGVVSFTEAGFALQNLTGKALGGDVKLTGGVMNDSASNSASSSQTIQVQGTLSAEGLRQYADRNLSGLQKLWPHIKGSTPYSLVIAPLAKNGNNIQFNSDLVGLEFTLPAPLTKSASTPWLAHYQQGFVGPELLGSVHAVMGSVASTSAAAASAWRIEANQDSPQQGLGISVQAPLLDASAWQTLMTDLMATGTTVTSTAALIPQRFAASIDDVVLGGRHFNHVVLGASRTGQQWRINGQASDFDGYAEYRPGQVLARLARLSIPDSASKTQIETLLTNEQASLPALDLVIDQFELGSKKLGRLEVQAVNQRAVSSLAQPMQQEWRIQKLWLTNADASFKSSGVWNGKSVDLPFVLDINDSGDLLTRMGLPGTLKGGKGQLQGRVGWLGSPLALHYPSLAGQIKLDVAKGQFLKIDPGAGRLLSVLSLQALPKLLTLDFRDVFSEGFAFDSVAGDASITAGVVATTNLQMKSVLALVSLEGSADLARETQNLRVLVLPDVNAGGASVLAAIINPLVGVATYLAQLVLRRPVVAAATKAYRIEGSWREPVVTQIKAVKGEQ